MKKILLTCMTMVLSSGLLAQTDVSQKPKNDAEITNALMTVNTQEMSMAKVAKKNAENPEVKKFADMMFKEHAKNNDKASNLAKAENIKLKETKTSMDLKFTSEDKVEKLKTLKGKEFDKEYMQTQVDMHKKVLEKLDNTLIPNAKSEDLKAMLETTRTNIEGHLKHAQKIQSTLL